MSIRTFLTLVIAVMGAALLAIVGQGMVGEAQRSARAERVAALAGISESLLPALIASRVERGTLVVAGMAADPADDASWQRLAEQRPIADTMTAKSIAALRTAPLAHGDALAQRIEDAHARVATIRPEIDAEIHRPRQERDQRMLNEYGETSAEYVRAITAAADAVEQATSLFDPEIDRLIFLNQQVSAARNYGSVITLRIEAADAFNLPWRPSDVVDAAMDEGRVDFAWQSVLAVAATPGIPEPVSRAIDAAKASATSADAKRQAEIIAALRAGKLADVPVSDLQRLDTGLLMPLNRLLEASTAEIVRRANHFQDQARSRLVLTATLMVVILCLTGLGVSVVQRRVSAPIRRITRQMARLQQPGTDSGSEDALEIETGLAADTRRNDEIGEMARALLVFRRQVEEHGRRLQEHEMRQFLEALIDAMPVAITFKDADLRYRYINRSRRESMVAGVQGTTWGDRLETDVLAVGKRLSEVIDPAAAAPIEDADRAVLATGEPQAFEQERTGPDRKKVVLWTLKTPFRDADGSVRGVITCGVDITRLKEIEAELVAQRQKAEAANRAKTAFLASMSHELRTPLNAIIGFADALAKGYLGNLDDRQQEYVGDIRSSGEHLLKLVNDLLDLSSLEIGRQVLMIAECSLDDIAASAVNMVAPQAERAGVLLDFAPTGLTVRADERALVQVLVNLLGNAVKFTPQGGCVSLEAERANGAVRIVVRDSGLGMTEAQRTSALKATLGQDPGRGPAAADPYRTRPKGGAGLGLAICRRLIEQHNGALEIESVPGAGSVVRVVLPG